MEHGGKQVDFPDMQRFPIGFTGHHSFSKPIRVRVNLDEAGKKADWQLIFFGPDIHQGKVFQVPAFFLHKMACCGTIPINITDEFNLQRHDPSRSGAAHHTGKTAHCRTNLIALGNGIGS